MELIKDYVLTLEYHEGKAKKVADAMSRKSAHSSYTAMVMPRDLCDEFWKLDIEVVPQGFVASLLVL